MKDDAPAHSQCVHMHSTPTTFQAPARSPTRSSNDGGFCKGSLFRISSSSSAFDFRPAAFSFLASFSACFEQASSAHQASPLALLDRGSAMASRIDFRMPGLDIRNIVS